VVNELEGSVLLRHFVAPTLTVGDLGARNAFEHGRPYAAPSGPSISRNDHSQEDGARDSVLRGNRA
jgi:hypothetical protein